MEFDIKFSLNFVFLDIIFQNLSSPLAIISLNLLSLIFLSTIVDYFVGLKIYDSDDRKAMKSYLWICILLNLGLLGFFKYFNFFIFSSRSQTIYRI